MYYNAKLKITFALFLFGCGLFYLMFRTSIGPHIQKFLDDSNENPIFNEEIDPKQNFWYADYDDSNETEDKEVKKENFNDVIAQGEENAENFIRYHENIQDEINKFNEAIEIKYFADLFKDKNNETTEEINKSDEMIPENFNGDDGPTEAQVEMNKSDIQTEEIDGPGEGQNGKEMETRISEEKSEFNNQIEEENVNTKIFQMKEEEISEEKGIDQHVSKLKSNELNLSVNTKFNQVQISAEIIEEEKEIKYDSENENELQDGMLNDDPNEYEQLIDDLKKLVDDIQYKIENEETENDVMETVTTEETNPNLVDASSEKTIKENVDEDINLRKMIVNTEENLVDNAVEEIGEKLNELNIKIMKMIKQSNKSKEEEEEIGDDSVPNINSERENQEIGNSADVNVEENITDFQIKLDADNNKKNLQGSESNTLGQRELDFEYL